MVTLKKCVYIQTAKQDFMTLTKKKAKNKQVKILQEFICYQEYFIHFTILALYLSLLDIQELFMMVTT
jgi:hypothetical protein